MPDAAWSHDARGYVQGVGEGRLEEKSAHRCVYRAGHEFASSVGQATSAAIGGDIQPGAQQLHPRLLVEQLSWRAIGAEMSALASLALTAPFGWWLLPEEGFDPAAPHPTPVVLVHGLLGDPTNFRVLRRFLATRGVRNFGSFSYRPRIDHRRLATELGHTLDAVCRATGVDRVDVVGHSLGGIVARYLLEVGGGRRVRRLVTLGSHYFTNRLPEQELAIFGTSDPIVPAPDPVHGLHGRVRIVPDCGHLGLLRHPTVLDEVARYLTRPVKVAAARPRAIGTRFPAPWRSSSQLALCPTASSARTSPTIRPS